MATRRISLSDIVIGQPLAWDVFGNDGSLLLRKGYVVSSANQVEVLIERGLFAEAANADTRDRRAVERPVEAPSVLRMMNAAQQELRRLLYSLGSEPNARDQLLALAKQVCTAVFMQPDVALGCILLNQNAGSYTLRHSLDTATVSLLVARAMKKPPGELIKIAAAALTMNVGMLRQQERFQEKSEALSTSEQDLIRQHPQAGVDLLRSAGVQDEDWLSWILLHHENEDGSGYPTGKAGADLPENAKIISLADRYCARVCTRSYRKSLLPNAALRDIMVEGKAKIDPMLLTVFIRELGTYPIGTFVRLQNGELGVVSGKGLSTTTPFVHSLVGPRGAPLSVAIRRDTGKTEVAIREVLHPDQVLVRFTMRHLWGEIASL